MKIIKRSKYLAQIVETLPGAKTGQWTTQRSAMGDWRQWIDTKLDGVVVFIEDSSMPSMILVPDKSPLYPLV